MARAKKRKRPATPPKGNNPPARQKPASSKQSISNQLVGYIKKLWPLLVALSTIFAWIGIKDLPSAREKLHEWGMIRSFSPAAEGENLILIADFYRVEGISDSDPDREIQRTIKDAAAELGLSDLRVEVEPTRLSVDDQAGAEQLGQRYKAGIIIWGEESSVRITVKYLNLKQPDFDAARVEISETERTQISAPTDPSAYTSFITQNLPGQLTFLALYAIGQSYYEIGDYSKSIDVIERGISSLEPEPITIQGLDRAYFRLGWLYQEFSGDLVKAAKSYDQALFYNEDLSQAYYNRGITRHHLGDQEGAIKDFSKVIELDAEDESAYGNRGISKYAQGDLEGAIRDYDKAITLNPKDPIGYYNRGIARDEQGDLERAIDDYGKAILLDPDYDNAYYNRAIAYWAQGRLKDAIDDFDTAIRINPRRGDAFINKGAILNALGDLKGAIDNYSFAIDLNGKDDVAYYNRAMANYEQANLDQALHDYTIAIGLNPANPNAYHNRGIIRIEQGDLEGAIEDFNEALRQNPGYSEAYYLRAFALDLQGDLKGAIDDLKHYLELNPNAEDRQYTEDWIAELEEKLANQ
jgi:tetratricopeptide (TPR) repeat protein